MRLGPNSPGSFTPSWPALDEQNRRWYAQNAAGTPMRQPTFYMPPDDISPMRAGNMGVIPLSMLPAFQAMLSQPRQTFIPGE